MISMPVPEHYQRRVYKFWCEPATPEDGKQIGHQIMLASNYSRDLVHIENDLRRAVEKIEQSDPQVKTAMSDVDITGDDDVARSAAWKKVRAAVKTVRATELYKAELMILRVRHGDHKKAARSVAVKAGLAWGTYQHADEAHAQACRMSPWGMLKHLDRHEEGAAAVHIQGRELLGSALEQDAWFGVGTDRYGLKRVARDHREPSTVGAQKMRRAVLRLSTGRSPVMTTLHVLMHREIPAEAIVSWARVHQVRIGPRLRWNLQVVVAEPPREVKIPEARAEACGVDLGWRKVEGGYRVAGATGSDGKYWECVVPNTIYDRAAKCDDLRSIRDLHLEEIKKEIVAAREDAPEWMAKMTSHTGMWRSPKRVHSLAHAVLAQAPDHAVASRLSAFIKKDDHLHAWQANNRRKMDRQIDALYDNWALDLARRYRKVGLEDMNLVELKKKSDLAQQRGATLAVGAFRKSVEDRAKGCRVEVIKVEASGTSARCSACGHWREKTSAQMMTCEKCGLTEDRDITASKNILARAVACAAQVPDPLARVKPAKILGVRRTRKKKIESIIAL